MTFSDISVLVYLTVALILAPRTIRATRILLALTVLTGIVSFLLGNPELLITSGAVLGALTLASLTVGLEYFKLQHQLRAYRQATGPKLPDAGKLLQLGTC